MFRFIHNPRLRSAEQLHPSKRSKSRPQPDVLLSQHRFESVSSKVSVQVDTCVEFKMHQLWILTKFQSQSQNPVTYQQSGLERNQFEEIQMGSVISFCTLTSPEKISLHLISGKVEAAPHSPEWLVGAASHPSEGMELHPIPRKEWICFPSPGRNKAASHPPERMELQHQPTRVK